MEDHIVVVEVRSYFLCSHGDRNKISACSGVRQIVCMIHHSDVLLMPYLLNQSKKKEKDNV